MNWLKKYGLLFVLFLTAVVYIPSLSNGFTHLDDYVQVVNNGNIKSFGFANLTAIFSSTSVGMYQPLTTLLYALTYQFFGSQAFGFHFLSLLFHLLNIILFFSLLKKFSIEPLKALLFTAIFAVHPMQVESVSWISAFSNLTYTLFYLLALICYRNFQLSNKRKAYGLVLLFFILSLLSKSTAVTLPLILLAFDYFENGKLTRNNWLNKIPFFLLSVFFGLIAIYSRESAGQLSDLSVQFGWLDRIFLISHSILFYPIKWLIPIQLSAFYPYPEVLNGWLPWTYYLSPLLLLTLFWLVWKTRQNKFLVLGTLVYLFSISLVIQLIPVGNQLTTDRYVYLPMFGFVLVLYAFLKEINSKKLLPIFGLWTLLLLIVTIPQSKLWKNDQLIWENVIDIYPNVAQAYNNLGSYQLQNGEAQKAFQNFDQAVKLKPYYADALSNRGNLYSKMGKSQKAIADFDAAIKLRPHADAYFNRANEYVRLGKLNAALNDYEESIALNPSPDTYTNWAYALLLLKEGKEAENKLKMALEISPQFAQAHFLLGMIAEQQGDLTVACQHFQTAAQQKHKQAEAAVKRFCR